MPEPQVAAPAVEASSGAVRGTSRGRTLAAAGPLVRWGFVIGAVALASYAVARDWAHIRAALSSLGFAPVAGALASVLLAVGTTVFMWRRLLASFGSPLPVAAAAKIVLIGQIGKYLPGSVWPVLAQMELGRAYQVPRYRSASASVLTMLLALVSGLLASLVTLPFAAGGVPYRWALLALPVLVALLHPRVLNAVLTWLLKLAKQPPLEAPLTVPALIRALAWSGGTWICYGAQIWILATWLGAPPGKTALIAVGGFAFAWCAGFVVVFAPAGAGVRDVLLLLMLRPVLRTADAAAVVLVSRVLLTVADLLAAAAATRLARRPAAPFPSQ